MKKLLSVLVLLIIAFSLTGRATSKNFSTINRVTAKEQKEKFVKDELIIGYNKGVNLEEASKKMKEKFGVTQLEVGYIGNFEVVKIPNEKKLEKLMEEIGKEKDVRFAEYNYLLYVDSIPNDPKFDPPQWNFFDRGYIDKNGYASDYGIQAVSAWNESTGSSVKVAVIDTGVAYENYGNKPKFKLAPDLANTAFDKVNAKNYTEKKPTTHANDDNGHGTHVCGTIAQSTNNSIGCAGIAYNATILPIKVMNNWGSGTVAAIANGINWAADYGAKVINLSLGSTSTSTVLEDAIKHAYSHGIVIVCGAGNNGSDVPFYPAAYSECIAVGAIKYNGEKANYSNFGSWVDIVAPGGEYEDLNADGLYDAILQQTFWPFTSSGSYSFNQDFYYLVKKGTSMASPHVAGVAALILSKHPSYTVEQVRTALLSTAKDLGTVGFDTTFGYGLLDAYRAVNYTP